MPQKSHPKYPVNIQIFRNEDALAFYLLGAFLTDGYVENLNGKKSNFYRVGLCSADRDWLECVRGLISPGRPIWKRRDQNVCRLEIANGELAEWLLSWGCLKNKSLTVELSKGIPEKYLADCVRGVFDGDGSLTIGKYNVVRGARVYTYPRVNAYICSGSKPFICGLSQRLKAAGFPGSIITTRNNERPMVGVGNKTRTIKAGVTWRLQFADGSAIRFLRWLYYPDHPLSMPRKALLAERAFGVRAGANDEVMRTIKKTPPRCRDGV